MAIKQVIDAADLRALVAVVVIFIAASIGLLLTAVVLGLAVRGFLLVSGLGS